MTNYAPAKLNSKHRELMRHMAHGEKVGEAADAVGMTRGAAYVVVTSDLFKVELKRMRDTIEGLSNWNEAHKLDRDPVKQLLALHAPEIARAHIRTALHGESERNRITAQMSVLDKYLGRNQAGGSGAPTIQINIDERKLAVATQVVSERSSK